MQLTSQKTERGVTERDFTVEGARDPVPGVLWTPEDPATTGPRPLVLLGHGGTQHKRVPNITSLARRLVRHHGIAAAAIDLPYHGDRMSDEERSLSREDRRRRMRVRMRSEQGHEAASQRAVDDWTRTLDALQAQDDVGAGPVGYWGVSMGTRYGVPLVAAEPRIRAAVLGLFGWAEGPRAGRLRRRGPPGHGAAALPRAVGRRGGGAGLRAGPVRPVRLDHQDAPRQPRAPRRDPGG
jgi:hypothetical protein